MSASARFRGELLLHGKTATGFEVPEDAVLALGGGKKPAVVVTIGDKSYRSTIAPRSGRYLLGVSAENRELTGISAGDTVDVGLELDTKPREVELPPELADAFAAEPALRETFEALSFTKRRELAEPISQAKKPKTRERRIEKALAALRS